MRASGVIAAVGGAIAGYAVGSRHDDIRARITCLTQSREQLPPPRARRASHDTEFDHVTEREAEHRHAAAEGIRAHPLRPHERQSARRDDAEAWAMRPLTEDDLPERRVAPRIY